MPSGRSTLSLRNVANGVSAAASTTALRSTQPNVESQYWVPGWGGALGRRSARKLEFVRPPVEREIVAVRKAGLIDDRAVEHAKLQLDCEVSHGGAAESHSSQTLRAILIPLVVFFTILMPAGPFLPMLIAYTDISRFSVWKERPNRLCKQIF